MARILSAVAALALTTLLAACGESKPNRPNVLIITVDTLRADRLGCYGYTAAETPAIDALAREGVLFEQAYTQVPITWPAHAALFTATYPFSNGVQDFTGQPLSEKYRTLPEAMKAAGYATGAVVSSYVLDRSWGLARGFDTYHDAFSGKDFLEKDVALVDRRAGESVDQAIGWLATHTGEGQPPFFFWLHLFDPHSPYDAPEPFGSRFRERPYDGEIAYSDSQLQRLLEWLRNSRPGLYDNTVIVFLSDHGESLGEHGEAEHGFFVYNATMQVPLVVKAHKGAQLAATRVPAPVETTGLAPTVLELAGIDDALKSQAQSASWRGLMAGEKTAERRVAYGETFYPLHSFGWSPLRALVVGNLKYIEAPQPEFYDLASDPGEKNNLAEQDKARTERIRAELQSVISRHAGARPQPGPGPSEEALAKLRSLGYVASRAPAASADAKTLKDPKDRVAQYQAILRATDLLRTGDARGARPLLEGVRRTEPNLYLVPFLLGEGAARERQWAAAEREFHRALELNPTFDQAMTALAGAVAAQGKTAEARQWFERALVLNPQNFRAWYALGRIEFAGDGAAAKRSFDKALTIQPSFAPAHRDLGLMAIREQDYSVAVRRLEKAVEFGLDDASLFNFLGIAYSRTSQLDRAVSAYQKALERDPKHAEAHLNLGFAYQRMNRTADAQREYATACQLNRRLCRLPQGR